MRCSQQQQRLPEPWLLQSNPSNCWSRPGAAQKSAKAEESPALAAGRHGGYCKVP